jgi:ABC-type dipeptide/oligopeptide/nickel transport system ATPase component
MVMYMGRSMEVAEKTPVPATSHPYSEPEVRVIPDPVRAREVKQELWLGDCHRPSTARVHFHSRCPTSAALQAVCPLRRMR